MKCVAWTLAFFAIFTLVSCSAMDEDDNYVVQETIKSNVDNINQISLWTGELEAGLESTKHSAVQGISYDMPITETNINASLDLPSAIVPSLQDFGSLDLSALDEKTLALLHDFCLAVCKKDSLEAFFKDSNLYSLFFFINDMDAAWQEAFELDTNEDEAQEQKPLVQHEYTSYILANAHYEDGSYTVSARFIAEGVFFDTKITIVEESIDEIILIRFSKSQEKGDI